MAKNKFDRIQDYIYELAKFCPICGKELVLVVKILGSPPAFKKAITMDIKACSDGHGDMGDSAEYGPDLTFRVDYVVFKDIE